MRCSVSILVMVLVTLVFIESCSFFPVKLSSRLTTKNQYNKIWIGWLDLGEQNYEKLGYPTQIAWKNEIKEQNIILQQHLQNRLKGFIVKGATTITDEPPKDPSTIVINFRNTSFDVKTSIDATISTDADFIDASSNNILYSLDQKNLGATITRSSRVAAITFGGRLNDAMYQIAYDIKYYLTH